MAYNAGAADLYLGKGCRIKATWVKLYTMWYFFYIYYTSFTFIEYVSGNTVSRKWH